ncbi:MAG: AzlD domain-containing protein [Halanaeroarchaeum sp.]
MATLSATTVWLAIAGGAIGSYLLRVSFIAIFGRVDSVPSRVSYVLGFVPAAVLAALVFPPILAPDGALALSVGNDRLLAGGIAAVVAWRTESMLATIAVGMGVLWLLTLVV